MSWKWNSLVCSLLVALPLFIAGVAASDDLVVDVAPNDSENGEVDEIVELRVVRNVKAANVRIQLNQDDANERQFEQQIFSIDGSVQKGREKAIRELKVAIRSLDAACRLSEFQKDKLALAGQADQKRFFDRVEAVRTSSQSGQKLSGAAIAEMLSLRTKYEAGLLLPDSFFAKSIGHTLTADQLTDGRRAYLRGLIDKTVRVVESYTTFEPSQHDAIASVLLEESPSPSAFWGDGKSFKKLEVLAMNHRFSTVAESKIKPLVNAEQWQDIQSWLEEFRRSHDALLFEEGRVVPGSNELAPTSTGSRTRKKLK